MADLQVPPQSVELEQGLLAAIMFSREAASEILDTVRAEDFYKLSHQKIIVAAQDLYRKGDPLDAAFLAEALKSRGLLEATGGAVYLGKIMEEPVPSNIQKACGIIRQKAALRKLINACNAAIQSCQKGGQDPDEIIESAQREIMAIQSEDSGNVFALDPLLDDARERYEDLHKKNDQIIGVPSFFHDLDSILAGYQPSDLIILAARPGMGKTAFITCNMVEMALHDIPCGVFSLEMSKEQIVDRIIAASARVNTLKFRSGKFADNDWHKITNAFGRLQYKPVWIDDSSDPRLSIIRKKARRMVKQGVKILFIDYLQLLAGTNQQNRNLEISEITRGLKLMAKELKIPIVLLSQLSRKCEERSDKRPLLSDLRDSGAIEQDADVVMFLYREEVYKATEKNSGLAELIIAKQRNGPTGAINLRWNAAATRFESLALSI